jgi:hypothetical protein
LNRVRIEIAELRGFEFGQQMVTQQTGVLRLRSFAEGWRWRFAWEIVSSSQYPRVCHFSFLSNSPVCSLKTRIRYRMYQ